jgi:hypothetical protein
LQIICLLDLDQIPNDAGLAALNVMHAVSNRQRDCRVLDRGAIRDIVPLKAISG